MRAAYLISALVLTIGMGADLPAAAQTAEGRAVWPIAADIPKPRPVSVPLAGSATADVTRFLMASGPSSAELSPDGSQLAYVSTVSGEPQVWVVEVAGGAPRRLTYGLGVDGVMWTPDGKTVLYGADKGGDERLGLYSVTPDGMKEIEVLPRSDAFTYPGDFGPDGRTLLYATTSGGRGAFNLYSAALDGSGSRMIAEGRLGLYPANTQPHGSLLLMQEARGERGNDLSVIDLNTGKEETLFKPAEPTVYHGVSWAPDGSGFFLSTDQDHDHAVLGHYDLASRQLHIIAEPEHEVLGTAVSPDGRILVYATDETGFHTLHALDLLTGAELPTPALPAGNYRYGFARDAPVLSIVVHGPTTPGEVWIWKPETNETRRVVAPDPAGIDLAGLATPEAVRFAARDGVSLSGLLYRPRGATGPVPVFLRLHGGPTSHARADWKPDMQYLVARGIAVLDFNYRGSDGDGKAGAALNDRRLRVNEPGDLADAVAWIRTQPGLDGAHVAVGGASYGGYLTNAVLGAYPDLFVAGVSEVGVADWVRNLENASPGLQASDRVEYGDVHDPDDRAFFASISPMNNAAKITTPLLVQVGDNDPRNGAGEQDAFVTAIREAGGTVTYMRYEGEGHILSDLPDIIDFYRAKAAFLLEHFGR
jgi:dipeptidyl aminopeptidase/acylaminoacyl peptidase